MNIQTLAKNIGQYCQANSDILLLYLFGSFVVKKRRSDVKDIDLAVLFNPSCASEFFYKKQAEVYSKLSLALNTYKLDIVVLNDASPLLQYEAIKNGKLIYEKEKDLHCDYEVSSLFKYYDLQPLRRYFTEGMLQRLKQGEFGAAK